MKKKLVIVVCGLGILAAISFGVIPVAAGSASSQAPAAKPTIGQIEAKLVSIQDAAKVDSLLAQAVAKGVITPAQSVDIRAYWVANHTASKIDIGQIEAKLVSVQDPAKVDDLLARAVAGGLISPAEAAQVRAYWEANHAANKVDISRIEAKLVSISDAAKVDAILAQAVANGMITPSESVQIKAFWKANHK